MNLQTFIATQDIPLNQTKRFDCPRCGSPKGLSVTRFPGQVKYHCFSASCKTSGIIGAVMSRNEIEQSLDKRKAALQWEAPAHWTMSAERPEVIRYLQRNHAYDAYQSGRIRVRYDPKENRAVFLIARAGEGIVGGVGRALKGASPKWLRYGPYRGGLIIPPMDPLGNDHCVLVEDAASACAVSYIFTGAALLGSSLTQDHINDLAAYKRVTIALDRDASAKAMAIHRSLSFFVPTVDVVLLREDLKTMDREQVERVVMQASV